MNIPPFVDVWINQGRKRFYLFKEEKITLKSNPLLPTISFKPENGQITVVVDHPQSESIFIAGAKRKSLQITEPTFFNFMNYDFFVDNVGDSNLEFSTTGMVNREQAHKDLVYARSDNPVLIIGDTGTGKELLAKNIHYNSNRRHHPFIVLNCASFEQGVAEKELFGNVRGAFTEAECSSKGAFITAGKGTLVLDDIGNLPMSVQPMLLRAIELGEIRAVGADINKQHNARLILTSSVSPQKLLESGRIREDFFYRIEACTVYLAELRFRTDEIIPLAQFFAGDDIAITQSAKQRLLAYNWPGNIRELKSVIDRAKSLIEVRKINPAIIDSEYLHINDSNLGEGFSIKDPCRIYSLQDEEKNLIKQTLLNCSGRIGKTSKVLHISRSTLLTKIKLFDL